MPDIKSVSIVTSGPGPLDRIGEVPLAVEEAGEDLWIQERTAGIYLTIFEMHENGKNVKGRTEILVPWHRVWEVTYK